MHYKQSNINNKVHHKQSNINNKVHYEPSSTDNTTNKVICSAPVVSQYEQIRGKSVKYKETLNVHYVAVYND